LVFKLPECHVEELEAAGIGHRFDPGHGRLMNEWLALDPRREEWMSYGWEALRYVRGAR